MLDDVVLLIFMRPLAQDRSDNLPTIEFLQDCFRMQRPRGDSGDSKR